MAATDDVLDMEVSKDVEKSTDTKQVAELTRENPSFPEGGTQAWAVATGHTTTMICTWGYLYAFGELINQSVYQTYYESHQLRDHSPSSIAWIGSLQLFFMCIGMMIGGPLFDRFGGTMIILPSVVVYVFSIMMNSLCHELWEFILAQGLLQGIAMGMILGPSSAATPQYFRKKRGAAVGLALTGSSIGGVIFPVALEKMLGDSHLTYGWSFRICGFIILGLMLPASLVIRPRLPPRKTDFFLFSAFKEIQYLLLLAAIFCCFMAIFTPVFFLPTFALEHGMSQELATYLIAILNAASWPGRLLPGLVGDKVGTLNTLIFVCFGTGITLLCWQAVYSNAGIIVFAAFFGFISGGVFTAGIVAFASCPKDPRNIGTYIGMAFGVGGIAALISPPINGVLLASHNGIVKVSILNGVFSLAAVVLVILSKLAGGHRVLAKA